MEKPDPPLAVDKPVRFPVTRITTADQPKSQRFAFWREAVCDNLFGLECTLMPSDDFLGEIEVARLKDVKFSREHNRGFKCARMPHWVRRGRWIRYDREDEIFVSLVLRGRLKVLQDGREADLGPGDLACFDSARPHSGVGSPEVEQLMLHIPRETWFKRIGPPEQLTARTIRGDTYMGALVANFLRQAVSGMDTVSPSAADRLADISIALVTTAFGDLISSQRISPSAGRISLFYRAKTLIEENLADPALNPERIARELKISERYLQDLFHQENTTVCDWMWQRRLEKCSQDLSDRLLAGKGISEVAFNYGFSSPQHFSRRFKAEFLMTPSEYRQHHLVKLHQ